MDLEEDIELLTKFNQINQTSQKNQQLEICIRDQKRQIYLLQEEDKRKFEIISKQAEVIRQYRTTIKTFMDQSPPPPPPIAEGSPLPAPPPPISPPAKRLKMEEKCKKIEGEKIRYPTAEDNYEDYLIGQTIWKTILRCFRKNPGAMITSDIIIQEGGNLVLTDKRQPYLDYEKLSQYFTFPFQFSDENKTITVRKLATVDSLKWMVFLPEWYAKEL